MIYGSPDSYREVLAGTILAMILAPDEVPVLTPKEMAGQVLLIRLVFGHGATWPSRE